MMNMSKRQYRRLAACLAAGILLTGAPALAAEENNSQDFMLDQVVVTANRVPLKLSETAANVSIITREEIEKKNYTSLGQALRNVNGVDVTSQGQPGAQSFVRLNGNDRVVVLVDGRRMNLDKGSGSGRAGFELNNLVSMANVERIEVVKGAASALYGSDAVGGVINIITRKGDDAKTTLDLSAGSWGARNYQLSNQGSEGDWSWFLTAGKQTQDYFSYKDSSDGKSKKMPNSAFEKENLTFRLDKEIDAARSLTLQVEHATDNGGQPGMVPGRSSQHFFYDHRDTLTNNYAITYHYDQDTDTAGYFRYYKNYLSRGNSAMLDGVTAFTNSTKGFDWQKSWQLHERSLLVGGAEWRDTAVENPRIYNDERHKVNNKAVYLENRMSINDKWTLTPGVRYDKHSMFGSETTPRVAVRYAFDAKSNAYISWGKVFNAPNTDDLFWSESGPGWEAKGNPHLKPETGETTTIGFNAKLSAATQLTASYFQNRLKDAINWDYDIATGISTPVNKDRQRSEGFEVEVRTALSPQWQLSGAYSYLSVEDKNAGESAYSRSLKNNQPNGYRIGVDYSQDAWNVNLTARGASGRSRDYFTSSGYWLLDAAIHYQMSDTAQLYLTGYNLTDKAYETVGTNSSYGGPGGYVMPGRNYQFGVRYSF
ncbi:MAG: TonB-dependent receptor [Sporomusaceae bacterium]|nr:TonB-dependent receptor [Sporomusaceae bacterium]